MVFFFAENVDSFVDQLKSGGQTVASDVTAMKSRKQVSKTVAGKKAKVERKRSKNNNNNHLKLALVFGLVFGLLANSLAFAEEDEISCVHVSCIFA